MSALRLLLSTLALAGAQAGAQNQAAVARYLRNGEPVAVAVDELALELAQRHSRTQRGREAVEHLINRELVRVAADAAGIAPTRADVDAWIENLRTELKRGGHDLDQHVAAQGMSRAEFAEHARSAVAHERLVMRALDLTERKQVTNAMLDLWLKEARGKTAIVTDEKQMPAGCVAKVGKAELSRLELGRVLLRSATAEERLQFARQVAWLRLVQMEAAQHGVAVSDEEARTEVAARRKQFESQDGRTGVRFDQVLAAEGLSADELVRWPVLIGQMLEQKLSRKLHPDESLAAELERDREGVLKRHGPRRRLEVLLLRIDPRAGEAATHERAVRLRQQLAGDLAFGQAARAQSDDPTTRVSGGDTGWHVRASTRLPDPLLAAGFAQAVGEVSEPVREGDGFWLVRTAGLEPAPADATLLQRMRDELVNEHRRQMFERAKFEMVAQAR